MLSALKTRYLGDDRAETCSSTKAARRSLVGLHIREKTCE